MTSLLTKINWVKGLAIILGTAFGAAIMATLVFPNNPQLVLVVIAFCVLFWLVSRLTNRLAAHASSHQQKWLWVINLSVLVISQLLMLLFLPTTVLQHATFLTHVLAIGLLDIIVGLFALLAKNFLITRDDYLMPSFLTLFLTLTSAYYLSISLTVMAVLLPLALVLVTIFNWSHASTTKRALMGISLFLIAMFGQAIVPSFIVLAFGITIVAMWLFIRQRARFMTFLVPFAVVLLGFVASVPTNAVLKQTATSLTSLSQQVSKSNNIL